MVYDGHGMESTARKRERLATFEDLLELPDDVRAEILDGVIVEKAAPSFEHSLAQSLIDRTVGLHFHGRGSGGGGGDAPGGWWIVTECDIELEPHQVVRPDVVGWRRDRLAERPRGRPVRVRPDWICEIVSESNAANDTVHKFQVFERHQIPHYWLVEPERGTLTVYRWENGHYTVALNAARPDKVRAEPFDAIEISIDVLCGADPE